MQYEEGYYRGRQAGPSSPPVFWVWRPTGEVSVEYWVFHKYGESGGFKPPGIGNPSVVWHIDKLPGGNYTNGCEFLDWVAEQESIAPRDLQVREHKITVLDCS